MQVVGAWVLHLGIPLQQDPTGRCSRNACCAAAIDFGRAIVIGAMTDGNSTTLRTATMIRASDGIATDCIFEAAAAEAGSRSSGGMAILTRTSTAETRRIHWWRSG
jgi:hypothetical protein